MQWHEIFILSILEILSVLLIWSKLNSNLSEYKIRSSVIIIIMPVITVIFDIYNIDIGFVINFILLCAMITALFKVPIKDTISQFFIVLIVVTSIQFLFTYILSYFVNTMSYSFTNGLIVNIATLIACIVIRRSMISDKIHKYYLKYRNHVVPIIMNIGGVILLIMYMWQIDKGFVWNHIALLLLLIIIWEGVNIYFLYQSIRIRQQQKIIHIHERYTPFLRNMVHEVRQRQHDFKNHLNALYGLTQIEDSQQAKEEMKQYIELLIERIKSTDQLLNIKDHILSAIIYSKKSLAEEKDIRFHVEFRGEIPEYPFEKHELVEVLGNLLDNAIEAVENNSSDNRGIVLILGTEEDDRIIEVKNTGLGIQQEVLTRMFERGFTTKKGKHRGYGLYNVQKIVDYHKGTIELSFDGAYTVFKILL